MLDVKTRGILEQVLLIGLGLVTLVITPYNSIDPVNLPKLSMLAFFGIVAVSFIVPGFKDLIRSNFRMLVIFSVLFVVQLLLVLSFSGSGFGQQFYGVNGRNTGALAYFSLVFLLLGAAVISDKNYLKKFTFVTLFLGLVLILYGQIQYMGLEPFPFVNAYASNVFGTFGNPNFMSAFMGLIAVVSFTMALNTAFNLVARSGLILLGVASIVIVYETHAKQGYLNFVAGVGTVAMLWLFMTKRKFLGTAVAGVGALGGGLVFLGLINAGPLAGYLYKASLEARGFYWRAGIKMLIEHPFFGVGMDGYGDWYRRSRSIEDTLISPGLVSNTAHNVFIDIASNGGFPLIAIYLAILGLVVASIVRVIKRSEGFDVYFVAIVGAWVAYQAQSFVSINQLGLAIWGWVLSGLIIGYEIHTRSVEVSESKVVNQKGRGRNAKISNQPLSSATVVSLFAGVLIGAFAALPPYIAATQYYKALQSGNATVIESAAYLKPFERMRFIQVASLLRDNKLEARAIVVVRDAAAKHPDSFEVWSLWASIASATPADVANAKAQMKRLDPHNPDLK